MRVVNSFFVCEMAHQHEISLVDRGIILGQLRSGRRQTDIALNMGVSQSAVSRIKSKFANHNTVQNLPRSGRPRVTSAREDQMMARYARRTQFTSGDFKGQKMF